VTTPLSGPGRIGDVTEMSIAVWGRQVPVSGEVARTDAARSVLERVAGFRGWADDTDHTLHGFERRTVGSLAGDPPDPEME